MTRTILRTLRLATLLIGALGIASAQCTLSATLSSVSTSSSYDNRANGVNAVNGNRPCQQIVVSFAVTGFTAMYLRFEGAPDNAGSPGTWVPLTPTGGVIPNPTMSVAASQTQIYNLANLRTNTNAQDWLRFNLIAFTTSGNVVCTMSGSGANPFPPGQPTVLSNGQWSLFSNPGIPTGLIIQPNNAGNVNGNNNTYLIPFGTAQSVAVWLQNNADNSHTNVGSILFRINGQNAVLQSAAAGVATAVTNWNFGENNSANALTTINFQFHGSTAYAFTPTKVTTPPDISGGTTFTVSGGGASSATGGGAAGEFIVGTTGTDTFVITINGATGSSAPNGWACSAYDVTAGVALVQVNPVGTAACSVKGAVTALDVIVFSATGF